MICERCPRYSVILSENEENPFSVVVTPMQCVIAGAARGIRRALAENEVNFRMID